MDQWCVWNWQNPRPSWTRRKVQHVASVGISNVGIVCFVCGLFCLDGFNKLGGRRVTHGHTVLFILALVVRVIHAYT